MFLLQNRIVQRLVWNSHTRNYILRLLEKFGIKRRRILCICWGGNKYGCNPKAITDCILTQQSEGKIREPFEIYYAFNEPEKFVSVLPDGIKGIQLGSLEYFYIIATSQFIIANTRFAGLYWPFKKKKGQFYIQTMHGGHGMKRQELEVKDCLSKEYVEMLYKDASRIDLMLSDSTFWTRLARTIFAYPDGEILEVGLPRNDIFFDEKLKASMKESNRDNKRYLIYCPTFRNNDDTSVYGFDVDRVVEALERRFGGEWYIRVHCHPNMLTIFHDVYDFSHPRMVDVAKEDLQTLLVSSDVAVTDYSSAGFEFALTNRPVFLLAKDVKGYDRGMYFNPRELPFPFAENDDELCDLIEVFDKDKYLYALRYFNEKVIGLKETGKASDAVVDWIKSKCKKCFTYGRKYH